MAVPTKTKKTSKRNKTVISRGVVGVVYNYTELCISYIRIERQLSVFEIYHISHSMVPKQKIKNTPIEDITLTYKLISLKQLDIFFYGKRKRFYVMKSLTTIWQFTSV